VLIFSNDLNYVAESININTRTFKTNKNGSASV